MSREGSRVIERVDGLNVGLDLRLHPELRERLVEIGPHFEDSAQMAALIRSVYGKLRARLDLPDERPEHLMRTAVVHDIGKSGPAGARGVFHDAVRRLFAPPSRAFRPVENGRTRTVSEFVKETEISEPEKIDAALRAAGIDPDKEPMLAFWRRHAKWSFDVLSGEHGPDIDADLAAIAASHHIFEEQNPAQLDVARAPKDEKERVALDMMLILTAIDKYQAFRIRGKLGHKEATDRTAVSVVASPAMNPALMMRFREVLDVISGSKDEMDRALER
jgi:hypothetical protein